MASILAQCNPTIKLGSAQSTSQQLWISKENEVPLDIYEWKIWDSPAALHRSTWAYDSMARALDGSQL